MNGSDFLNKLADLDPSLIAEAAEPPRHKARRGPDWNVFAALAACAAAICLPLALTYLVHGITPTIEYGPGSNNGSTSHQASPGDKGPEGGSGLGNSQRDPNKGQGDGDSAKVYVEPEPQVSVMSYGEEYSWTRYTLDEAYCSAYPDGLPAENYFKYNVQGLGSVPELWGGVSYDMEPLDPSSARTSEWVEEFSGLLSGDYSEPVISADLSGDLKRISIQAKYGVSWRDDGSDSRLTVDICEVSPVDSVFLAPLKALSNETVAVFPKDSYGERKIVFALGGLDSDRCLYTWLPYTGIWCRIISGSSVPVEDMTAILDWIFSIPELLEDVHPLAPFTPAVCPYIPTPKTNDCAAPIDGVGSGLEGWPGQAQREQNVLTLEASYQDGVDGKPLESYRIDLRYEGENGSIGELSDLTRNMVESQYNFQKRFMATSRSSDRNMESQPMHYVFNFTWDDYYVTATFSETLTADQLWSFFQQLAGEEEPLSAPEELQGL